MLSSVFVSLSVFTVIRLKIGETASLSQPCSAIISKKRADNLEGDESLLLNITPNFTLSEPTQPVLTNQTKRHSAIVFPDSTEDLADIIFPVDVSQCGTASTVCEDVTSYPYEHIKFVLNKRNDAKGFFGVDEGAIEHRIGEPDDNFICASLEKTIFPKAGKNKYSKWKYIINQGDNDGYVQGVRIETCVNSLQIERSL
ncbi:protein spaetzle-like isoform X2 [Photinus pyralis]|uniref:protein spaetzle-like isoform X2 n=1 Tax=Photinus pyralis TaxID=7054 RepID=UPI001267581F|nr:protein spaetzle-like isoform X2 [Photinus pyralis]XP_031355389.1 protein spaetzle-like isoform X2 [Photinus pyralis]